MAQNTGGVQTIKAIRQTIGNQLWFSKTDPVTGNEYYFTRQWDPPEGWCKHKARREVRCALCVYCAVHCVYIWCVGGCVCCAEGCTASLGHVKCNIIRTRTPLAALALIHAVTTDSFRRRWRSGQTKKAARSRKIKRKARSSRTGCRRPRGRRGPRNSGYSRTSWEGGSRCC